jgi:hypothetical protein
MSIITGMVKAAVINALLLKIQRQAESIAVGDNIEITTNMLESSNVTSSEFSEVLQFMTTHRYYNCIDVEIYSRMSVADDGFQTFNVIGRAKLLPSFDVTAQGFTRYYRFKQQPDLATSIYPREDWSSLAERFEDPQIDWGVSDNPVPEIADVDVAARPENAALSMIGNDVVVNLKGQTVIIKKLRNDQAPVYFMRYMLQNPDRFIDTAQIQDEVNMCSQKKDMTELVRQCGFNKAIKRYFFNGTTKDKVRLITTVKLPSEIVAQILS